jgi:selenide,water dikinase
LFLLNLACRHAQQPPWLQLAVNLSEWLRDCKTRPPEKNRYAKVADIISPEQAVKAFKTSERSMCRLNRSGAKLMHKYDAHACTDVTGFGVLGHAQNLVDTQLKDVDFVLHTLPIVRDMEKIDGKVHDFKLLAGYSGMCGQEASFLLPFRPSLHHIAPRCSHR